MKNNEIEKLEQAAFNAGYGNQQAVLEAWATSNGYTQNVTGDACQGDEVCCLVGVFSGSYRNAKLQGYNLLQGLIIRDSYGAKSQQHTFTLELPDGTTKRIKGRNLYRNGTYSKPREAEDRAEVLEEKHSRGSAARSIRDSRRGLGLF